MHNYWWTRFRKLSFFCLEAISSKFTHKVSIHFVICSNFSDSFESQFTHLCISLTPAENVCFWIAPSLVSRNVIISRYNSLPLKYDWKLYRHEIKVLLSSYRTIDAIVTFLWVSLLLTISCDTISYVFSTKDVWFSNILKHSQYGMKILEGSLTCRK